MQASARCFHQLEWPHPGSRLAGPVVWLRGWVVGRPGHDFTDVRVRHDGGTHLGILGLPRTDLAAHFSSPRAWLPAEYVVGVPVRDGPVTLTVEAMDAFGAWIELHRIDLTIAPDGLPAPRTEGRLETSPDGTWTVRDAHHPFHGHLDEPGGTPALRHGRAPVFGWLLDATRPLAAVLATTDGLVFNHLEHSLTDDALAAKVPHLPAARHGRLRGPVDYPATLTVPACLRVYALSPDGTATLCFAQRLSPAGTRPPDKLIDVSRPSYPVLPDRPLLPLPSGRPRRLLLVVRSLWPNDETLRALDLARHLTASHRWAARVVSAEDGPLRQDFEQAGAESLVVSPAPLFAAADETALKNALHDLHRQIWWGHLDAVAVFDPVCGWAITLARQQGIPVLFDCQSDEPLAPDPTALPAVQALLRTSWLAATALCFGSVTAARAQLGQLKDRPAEIITPWHSPELPVPTPASRVAFAPLRTVDWLARYHPAVAACWTFRQGPAGRVDDERLARLDDALPPTRVERTADWSVAGVALCLGPLFGRGPLRPLIDAAAAGIPVVAPRLPLTAELFRDSRLPLVDEANPPALAHALLAWETLPASFAAEAAAFAPLFRARHDPAQLLARWERLLARVAATRG
ncbi:hypothetical protein Verru16b_02030 [Lacunisphaera limnophila]|uniref:Uncharacterized protein n=1 Tax=Lacunisphaera limnophila TaxID=1838286 RepID=A0A1D8AVR0_9BACT|nr:hypothetical protein [Lacunisphaera limnophila]AOS44961.1 hypothetical protein Verru16b_02030 [Lacunisphaera limnophila]